MKTRKFIWREVDLSDEKALEEIADIHQRRLLSEAKWLGVDPCCNRREYPGFVPTGSARAYCCRCGFPYGLFIRDYPEGVLAFYTTIPDEAGATTHLDNKAKELGWDVSSN